MKIPQFGKAAFCVGVLWACAVGQVHSQILEDETAIRRLEDQERGAVLAGNVDALKNIWSEKMMVNSPLGRISADRSETFRLMDAGIIRYKAFERDIENLRINGGLAVVMGSETVVPDVTAPGAGQRIKRRFTDIWQKDGTGWKLVARHANNIAEATAK
jgi:ketosteroid isomerase-like protein